MSNAPFYKPHGNEIELFEHASVLHNLLVGGHTHRKSGFWSELFFTRKTMDAEVEAREKAEHKLTDVRVRLADLQRIEEALKTIVERCRTTSGRVKCPLIAVLKEK